MANVLDAFASDHRWFGRDEETRSRYARDMSMYRILPDAVAEPRDESDVRTLVRFARENRIAVIPRGGGTNTGGSAVGRGIIVRFAPNGYWDRIEQVGECEVECGPAARHDAVQKVLAEQGAVLPSDPSSGPISYIGGNVATKASGPHALKHGAIDRYITLLDAVAADGTVVSSGKAIPTGMAEGMDSAARWLRENEAAAEFVSRKGRQKCASGYSLSVLQATASNAERFRSLMVGSAGTLGLITGVRIRGVRIVEGEASVLLFFPTVRAACDSVPVILGADPAAVEIMDPEALAVVVEQNADLGLPEGSAAMLMVELRGPDARDRGEAARRMVEDATTRSLLRVGSDETDRTRTEKLWTVRKRLFPTLKRFDERLRAYSVVNDVGVPIENLGELVVRSQRIFDELGLRAPIYGHAGSGNLHLRPLFDRRSPELRSTVREVARRIYGAVLELDGTVTAEHGMGRLRTEFMRREWGEDLFGLMLALKRSFDPEGILNPEVLAPDGDLLDHAELD